jgi:hypothetical protein
VRAAGALCAAEIETNKSKASNRVQVLFKVSSRFSIRDRLAECWASETSGIISVVGLFVQGDTGQIRRGGDNLARRSTLKADTLCPLTERGHWANHN